MSHICRIFAAVAQRPVKITYRNGSLQFGEALWNIKREDKVGIADCVSLTPAWRGAEPLSLTSGALRPLSQQHLISPLNLGLTRSFGSKGLPLCLQPSSTNGAWSGIEERWRVVARRKNQPRGGWKWGQGGCQRPVVHRGCGNVGCSYHAVDSVSGAEHLFTPPLIKINGPSLLLGRLLPIHLSDVVGLFHWPFCCPNSDSFRTVLRAHLGKGQHSRSK